MKKREKNVGEKRRNNIHFIGVVYLSMLKYRMHHTHKEMEQQQWDGRKKENKLMMIASKINILFALVESH